MAKIEIKSTLNDAAYKKGIQGMKAANTRLGQGLSKLRSKLAAAFTVVAITKYINKVISAAAAIEDYATQMKILLGTQKESAAIMAELKKFSAETPFQLGDIVNASQQLLNMTEGALGGVESLRILGDVAAATGNKDFANVAYWVGRFYASLKTGRPIIDSANALQRLKIMAPSVVAEMIRMEEAGADGTEMWDVFVGSLSRFEGGMKSLSETVSGRTSTMKDNWILALAEMGKAMKPFTMLVLNSLILLSKGFGRLIGGIQRVGAFLGALSAGESVRDAWALSKQVVEEMTGDMAPELEHKFTMKMKDAEKRKKTKQKAFDTAANADRFRKMGGLTGGTLSVQYLNSKRQTEILEKNEAHLKNIVENTKNPGGLL